MCAGAGYNRFNETKLVVKTQSIPLFLLKRRRSNIDTNIVDINESIAN